MKFSEQEVMHGCWMLENQIDTVFELIALWLLFPNTGKRKVGPPIERYSPNWFDGLKDMIEQAARDDRDGR